MGSVLERIQGTTEAAKTVPLDMLFFVNFALTGGGNVSGNLSAGSGAGGGVDVPLGSRAALGMEEFLSLEGLNKLVQ